MNINLLNLVVTLFWTAVLLTNVPQSNTAERQDAYKFDCIFMVAMPLLKCNFSNAGCMCVRAHQGNKK